MDAREIIVRRAALELRDGAYVNLGIGMPTLIANYIPEGREVIFQSENGLLGIGPFPTEDEVDPDLINAGTYVIEPHLLERVPEGERHSFERQFFPGLLADGLPVYGFPSDAYWLDIGTPAKYLQAHHDILDRQLPFDFSGEELRPGVWVEEGTVIEEGALLSGPCCIGRDCHLRSGAVIRGRSVLGHGCCVGPEAVVEGSVLLDGVRVGEECEVHGSILGRGVRLGRGAEVRELCVLGEEVSVGDYNQLRMGLRVWPRREIPPDTLHF